MPFISVRISLSKNGYQRKKMGLAPRNESRQNIRKNLSNIKMIGTFNKVMPRTNSNFCSTLRNTTIASKTITMQKCKKSTKAVTSSILSRLTFVTKEFAVKTWVKLCF